MPARTRHPQAGRIRSQGSGIWDRKGSRRADSLVRVLAHAVSFGSVRPPSPEPARPARPVRAGGCRLPVTPEPPTAVSGRLRLVSQPLHHVQEPWARPAAAAAGHRPTSAPARSRRAQANVCISRVPPAGWPAPEPSANRRDQAPRRLRQRIPDPGCLIPDARHGGDRDRTDDLLLAKQALFPAELRPRSGIRGQETGIGASWLSGQTSPARAI